MISESARSVCDRCLNKVAIYRAPKTCRNYFAANADNTAWARAMELNEYGKRDVFPDSSKNSQPAEKQKGAK